MVAKDRLLVVMVVASGACGALSSPAHADTMRDFAWTEYLDKVQGGWLGQCIGVTLGTPWEFRVSYPDDVITSYESGRFGKMPDGTPEQDDVLTEMAVLAGMRETGPNLNYDNLTEIWRKHVPVKAVYCASRTAMEAIEEGIKGPDSGSPNYNTWWHSIDAQIQGELMGLLTPGMGNPSRTYASMMAHMDNYAEGADGGIFVSCCMSEAFFEKDVEKLVRKALRSIHRDSAYARMVRDMLKWHRKCGDWHDTRNLLAKHYADHGHVGAVLNGGAVILALLYGQGDFEKTICIATMAGWDSDCNPATAGAIVGCMIGARAIPPKWSEPIHNTYHNYSVKAYAERVKIDELASETALMGEKVVLAHGATVTGEGAARVLHLPAQKYEVPEVLEEVTGVRAEQSLDHCRRWRGSFTPKWILRDYDTWNPDWTFEGKQPPCMYLPKLLGYTNVMVAVRRPGELPIVFVPKGGAVNKSGMLKVHVASSKVPNQNEFGDLLVRILVNGVVAKELVVKAPEQEDIRDATVECSVESGDAVRIEASHTGDTNAPTGIIFDKIDIRE